MISERPKNVLLIPPYKWERSISEFVLREFPEWIFAIPHQEYDESFCLLIAKVFPEKKYWIPYENPLSLTALVMTLVSSASMAGSENLERKVRKHEKSYFSRLIVAFVSESIDFKSFEGWIYF